MKFFTLKAKLTSAIKDFETDPWAVVQVAKELSEIDNTLFIKCLVANEDDVTKLREYLVWVEKFSPFLGGEEIRLSSKLEDRIFEMRYENQVLLQRYENLSG